MAVPAFSCVLFSGQGDRHPPTLQGAHGPPVGRCEAFPLPGGIPGERAGERDGHSAAVWPSWPAFLRFITFFGLGVILAGVFWAWQSRRQRPGAHGSARTRSFPVCLEPTRYGPKRDFALFGAGGVALLREQRTPKMACRAMAFQIFLHALSTEVNTPPKPVLPTGRIQKSPDVTA